MGCLDISSSSYGLCLSLWHLYTAFSHILSTEYAGLLTRLLNISKSTQTDSLSLSLPLLSFLPSMAPGFSYANTQLWHVGSCSLTRDRTWAPGTGSTEMQTFLMPWLGDPRTSPAPHSTGQGESQSQSIFHREGPHKGGGSGRGFTGVIWGDLDSVGSK